MGNFGRGTAALTVVSVALLAGGCGLFWAAGNEGHPTIWTGVKGGAVKEVGRDFLVSESPEETGFGRYSYLLIPEGQGSDTEKEQHMAAVLAWVQMIEPIERPRHHYPKEDLNIAYMPVMKDPVAVAKARGVDLEGDSEKAAKLMLEQYDHVRARKLLSALPEKPKRGVFIISTSAPLSLIAMGDEELGTYYYNDMSKVSPGTVSLWVETFLDAALRETWWEHEVGFADHVRDKIEKLGCVLPDVKKSIAELLSLPFWRG